MLDDFYQRLQDENHQLREQIKVLETEKNRLDTYIEHLQDYVGSEMVKSDYPTAAAMRTALENALRLNRDWQGANADMFNRFNNQIKELERERDILTGEGIKLTTRIGELEREVKRWKDAYPDPSSLPL